MRKIVLMVIFVLTLAGTDARAANTCPGNNVCYVTTDALVLTQPKIYLVYWGFGTPFNDPQQEIPVAKGFLIGLQGTHWLSVVAQYYMTSNNGSGTTFIQNNNNQVVGSINDTNPLPADDPNMGQQQWQRSVELEASRVAQAQGLPSTTAGNNIVLIMITPPRVNYPYIKDSFACAAHGRFGFLAYIDFPYIPGQVAQGRHCYSSSANDEITALLTHELTETITDPYSELGQISWSDNNGLTGEVGDKCSNPIQLVKTKLLSDSTGLVNTFAIPRIWSAAAAGGAGGCVFSYVRNSTRAYVTNGTLWTASNTDTVFTNRGAPSGAFLTGDPALVSWGPNRVDVFAIDTSGHVRHAYSLNGGASIAWDDWGSAPAGFSFVGGKVAAASWGPQHLDVFALSAQGKVFHYLWNVNADNTITATGWELWNVPVSGNIVGGIDAVSDQPNHVNLFVVDDATPSHLMHATRVGSSGTPTWETWSSGPGGPTLTRGQIGAASWGPNRFDVFAVDTGSNLQHWWKDGNTGPILDANWGRPAFAVLSGSVRVTAMGDNRLYIYAAAPSGGSGVVYRRVWDFGDRGWNLESSGQNVDQGRTFSGAKW